MVSVLVGTAGSSKKLEIIICLDASFIAPHSFLWREKNKKLIVLLWSHERETEMVSQQCHWDCGLLQLCELN